MSQLVYKIIFLFLLFLNSTYAVYTLEVYEGCQNKTTSFLKKALLYIPANKIVKKKMDHILNLVKNIEFFPLGLSLRDKALSGFWPGFRVYDESLGYEFEVRFKYIHNKKIPGVYIKQGIEAHVHAFPTPDSVNELHLHKVLPSFNLVYSLWHKESFKEGHAINNHMINMINDEEAPSQEKIVFLAALLRGPHRGFLNSVIDLVSKKIDSNTRKYLVEAINQGLKEKKDNVRVLNFEKIDYNVFLEGSGLKIDFFRPRVKLGIVKINFKIDHTQNVSLLKSLNQLMNNQQAPFNQSFSLILIPDDDVNELARVIKYCKENQTGDIIEEPFQQESGIRAYLSLQGRSLVNIEETHLLELFDKKFSQQEMIPRGDMLLNYLNYNQPADFKNLVFSYLINLEELLNSQARSSIKLQTTTVSDNKVIDVHITVPHSK